MVYTDFIDELGIGTTVALPEIATGLDMAALPTLAEHPPRRDGGPVLFKSCGSALWDLAAARCAVG